MNKQEQVEKENRHLRNTLDLLVFTVLCEQDVPQSLVDKVNFIISESFPIGK